MDGKTISIMNFFLPARKKKAVTLREFRGVIKSVNFSSLVGCDLESLSYFSRRFERTYFF